MVRVERNRKISDGFIPREYLPPGADQYYLRNRQQPCPARSWRLLDAGERKELVKNGNRAEEWDTVLVSTVFDPSRVRNSRFCGLVRIGRLDASVLDCNDLRLETGISNCTIVDCDIGDDVVLRDVGFCARYIIGDACMLSSIDELQVRSGAAFGCGILKDGEEEDERLWIAIMNEAGGRRILPFDGMIPADAYLWGKYRDDKVLMQRLKEITQNSADSRRGLYGTIGEGTLIKSTGIIRDVRIGPNCSISGAGRLENLTVNSSVDEPSRIGEGVELAGGIIGRGCSLLHGSRAVRFVMGDNSSLSYGARLIDTVLGDNSTVSCCEMRNNLIFPAHEQHHNNSFLIASVIMGQSNLAAGATVGSNHNSRAADNELVASRGFWPGLCVSLKHPSRFASYTLIAKGTYPAELNQPLPFSLLNNNETRGELEIIPAFWWNYNMYALIRNAGKFAARDRRVRKRQHIEFDFLAPDTAAEIRTALELLGQWDPDGAAESFEVPPGVVERSARPVRILKAGRARQAYREMLGYYIALTLLPEAEKSITRLVELVREESKPEEAQSWTNLGGQLVPNTKIDRLREEIGSGSPATWDEIHRRYDLWWKEYPAEKLRNACAHFRWLEGGEPGSDALRRLYDEAGRIQNMIAERVYRSRNKDLSDPFKSVSFRSEAERQAVQGTIDENDFVQSIREESSVLIERFRALGKVL
jgi:Domain of unknown function (DUF4954)